MNSLLKKMPIIVIFSALSLCLSACGDNKKTEVSSRSYSELPETSDNIQKETSDNEEKPGQSDINIDTGDVKVRVGDKGVYTKVRDDITVETDEDGARVKVGGISVNVGSGGVSLTGLVNGNTELVNSALSGLGSMFGDDDSNKEDN
jgi:hypothetical protein